MFANLSEFGNSLGNFLREMSVGFGGSIGTSLSIIGLSMIGLGLSAMGLSMTALLMV